MMTENKSDNTDRVPYGVEPDETPEKPGLLDDFDEDADFDEDPEVEQALAPKAKPASKVKPAPEGEPQDHRPTLVRPWFDGPKALGVAGGILAITALVTTWVTAPDQPLSRTLLTLYQTAVHTGTGVVAVLVAALFLDLRPGRLDVAAGRMFVAVSAFQIVAHMNIWLETRIVEGALAAILYAAIVAGLFRLWRDKLLVILIAHFGLVLIVQVGMWLSSAVAAKGS
jgi:hypothetical protein